MLATTAASTWGVTGAQFLWGYGALCALAALAVWHERRRVLGPASTSRDPQPDLDAYRLALLSGGPDHAITVAAAELMRDGRLRGDGVTISANGEPAATADALEREVFEAVRREPGLSIEEVQARVRDSATMAAMIEQMTRSGLLVGGSDAARVRLLWVVPALLAAVGLARILAGGDGILAGGDDSAGSGAVLFALVAAAILATVRLVGTRPLATNRGRSVLDRRRSDSTRARLYPSANEIGLMTALYGGGALWVADPVTASALHVPREKEPGTGGGGGGGGGDGWFDASGWFSGGSFGDGGGDGGGCGGGGGGGCGGGGGGGG